MTDGDAGAGRAAPPDTDVDVVVVGAGPGGLGAAVEAAALGARVVVLDEQHRAGGRLPGQLHEDRRSGRFIDGAAEAARLLEEAREAGVELRLGAAVFALAYDGERWIASASVDDGAASFEIRARAAVVATGAAERPVPVPGWTLPGVITVGAAQVLAQVHRVLPGETAVVVGIDPLSLGIARQLSLAGVTVRALVLPPKGPLAGSAACPAEVLRTLSASSSLAPTASLRVAGRIGRSLLGARLAPRLYPSRGVRVWGMPVQVRRAAVAIEGDERARAVLVAPVDAEGAVRGEPARVPCDVVCLGGGLHPLVELVAATGARMGWIDELGGEVPRYDDWLETSERGLFVAGNAGGVEGASVAGAYGRLAGVGVARRLGLLPEDAARERAEVARASIERARAEAPLRFHPFVERGRARLRELSRVAHSQAGS